MDRHLLLVVWNETLIGDKRFMYGFVRRSPYAVYVTNLLHLYQSCPTTKEVSEQALQAGVSEFDSSKLSVLVSQLEQWFADPNLPRFHHSLDGLLRIDAPLTQNFTWAILLHQADPETCAIFFRLQLTRSLLNHSFLLFKIAKLQETIRAKDNYTLYLEENYKTVNGSELIDKYKRQHIPDADLLAKFDPHAADLSVRSAYTNLSLKLAARADATPDSLFWNYVSPAINDAATWELSAAKGMNPEIKEHDEVSLKREAEHSMPQEMPSKKVKLEPAEPAVKPKQISPRRKRIGFVRRK